MVNSIGTNSSIARSQTEPNHEMLLTYTRLSGSGSLAINVRNNTSSGSWLSVCIDPSYRRNALSLQEYNNNQWQELAYAPFITSNGEPYTLWIRALGPLVEVWQVEPLWINSQKLLFANDATLLTPNFTSLYVESNSSYAIDDVTVSKPPRAYYLREDFEDGDYEGWSLWSGGAAWFAVDSLQYTPPPGSIYDAKEYDLRKAAFSELPDGQVGFPQTNAAMETFLRVRRGNDAADPNRPDDMAIGLRNNASSWLTLSIRAETDDLLLMQYYNGNWSLLDSAPLPVTGDAKGQWLDIRAQCDADNWVEVWASPATEPSAPAESPLITAHTDVASSTSFSLWVNKFLQYDFDDIVIHPLP